MADTPDPQPGMANTPEPVCDNCGSNPPRLVQSTMPSDVGQIDPKPWCEGCIVDRFDRARDEESDFPFILNGVVQDPGMSEYQDMFNDAYILTWRAETSAWSIPAELRRYCNCNAAHFVGKLNPIGGLKPDDEVANYRSCSACSKLWCMRCGDPVGPSGLPDLPVSNHTGPTYCRDTWAIREAAREKLCQALKGLDHQLCPRCDAPTKARDEELRSECAACNLPFCFACGLSQCEYPEAESSDSGEEPAGETAR